MTTLRDVLEDEDARELFGNVVMKSRWEEGVWHPSLKPCTNPTEVKTGYRELATLAENCCPVCAGQEETIVFLRNDGYHVQIPAVRVLESAKALAKAEGGPEPKDQLEAYEKMLGLLAAYHQESLKLHLNDELEKPLEEKLQAFAEKAADLDQMPLKIWAAKNAHEMRLPRAAFTERQCEEVNKEKEVWAAYLSSLTSKTWVPPTAQIRGQGGKRLLNQFRALSLIVGLKEDMPVAVPDAIAELFLTWGMEGVAMVEGDTPEIAETAGVLYRDEGEYFRLSEAFKAAREIERT